MREVIHGLTRDGSRAENKQGHFYSKWLKMRYRCNNPKCRDYPEWGGRGIRVLWDDFLEFKADMYDSYLKHLAEHGKADTTIDRINVNGDYCKYNCRRLTRGGQTRNRRQYRR